MPVKENTGYPVFTIGHSTREIGEFVALLRAQGVRFLVDVRSIPRSRTNPQYNLDILPDTLAQWQIGYMSVPELGGRRNRQKGVPPDVNGWWRNRSFHNYADYAMSAGFRSGLDRLLARASETPSAIMCAEAVWWRCHRRIIADYLLVAGRTVVHLMDRGHAEPARITPAAHAQGHMLTYPPA